MANENLLISIGVPCYNRPESLEKVLNGILAQSFSNYEVIIADDASPNAEVQKLGQHFATLDSRFRYFRHQQNLGVLVNARFVLEQARGDFFTIFADDDWHSPEFLKDLLRVLADNPACPWAMSDYQEVYSDGTLATGYPKSHISRFRPFTSRSRAYRVLNYSMQHALYGKQNLFYSLFKTSALRDIDFKLISKNYQVIMMDNLIVFSMLQKWPIALCQTRLMTLTVGNQKFYSASAGVSHSKFAALVKLVMEQWRELGYLMALCRNILSKLGMLFAFPFKILLIIVKAIKSKV